MSAMLKIEIHMGHCHYVMSLVALFNCSLSWLYIN